MPISADIKPCVLCDQETGDCKAFGILEDNIPSLAEVQTTTLQGSPIGTIQIPINWKCTVKENPEKKQDCFPMPI